VWLVDGIASFRFSPQEHVGKCSAGRFETNHRIFKEEHVECSCRILFKIYDDFNKKWSIGVKESNEVIQIRAQTQFWKVFQV
jgi:hypothetical protein